MQKTNNTLNKIRQMDEWNDVKNIKETAEKLAKCKSELDGERKMEWGTFNG
jgi:hypothetical protein